jgi:hypothetical protein
MPIFLWTTVSNDLRNKVKYPTVIAAGGTVRGLVLSVGNVLRQFNWTEAGFLYTDVDANDAGILINYKTKRISYVRLNINMI